MHLIPDFSIFLKILGSPENLQGIYTSPSLLSLLSPILILKKISYNTYLNAFIIL